MYRKFKYLIRALLLTVVLSVFGTASLFGYLTRQEAFSQSFDLVWSTVHESHWDETFGGHDWEKVRTKYRPKLRQVKNRTELVNLLQAMVNELELSHYRIMSHYSKEPDKYPRGGFVGLNLKYLEGRVYVTHVAPGSPADLAGIEVGWRLKSIHRKSVKGLTSSILRRNIPDKLKYFHIDRYLNEVIQGGANKRIRSDWYPQGKRAVKLYMNPIADSRELSDPVGYMPSQRIEYSQVYMPFEVLYIRFNYFLPILMSDIRDAIQSAEGKASGIVLDLRSNVGGLSVMATGITGLLVDEPTNLGKLILRKGHLTYQGYPQAMRFSGPVAILVDSGSASTTEMLAVGLQEAGRARVFGEPSIGQALPSLFKILPSGDVFQYAVGDYITPSGYRIEKNGVVPDEFLKPSFEELENGIDLPLDRATAWILEQANTDAYAN